MLATGVLTIGKKSKNMADWQWGHLEILRINIGLILTEKIEMKNLKFSKLMTIFSKISVLHLLVDILEDAPSCG